MSYKTDNKKEIGARIHDLRLQKKLSQEELAKAVGYKSKSSRSTINKIENGINDITQSKLPLYAKALGVSVTYLLFGSDQESNRCDYVNVINCIEDFYGNKAVELIKLFAQLNDEGKKKAVENLEDLTAIEKYTIEKGAE